jgi:hypothetical protein
MQGWFDPGIGNRELGIENQSGENRKLADPIGWEDPKDFGQTLVKFLFFNAFVKRYC